MAGVRMGKGVQRGVIRVFHLLCVFGQAPPCTETGVPIEVGFEIGAGMLFTASDCTLTDFGVASTFGVGLASILRWVS